MNTRIDIYNYGGPSYKTKAFEKFLQKYHAVLNGYSKESDRFFIYVDKRYGIMDDGSYTASGSSETDAIRWFKQIIQWNDEGKKVLGIA